MYGNYLDDAAKIVAEKREEKEKRISRGSSLYR